MNKGNETLNTQAEGKIAGCSFFASPGQHIRMDDAGQPKKKKP